MKNLLLTLISYIFIFSFLSCKDGNSTNNHSSSNATQDTTEVANKKQAATKNNSKTLQLGEHQLTYESNYEFVYDDIFTQNLIATSPAVDGKYYNLSMPRDRSIIGLSYLRYETNAYIDGAIDGILGGFKNMPGVVLTNQNIEDVAHQYGLKAKMGSGNIKFSAQSGVGEYRFLVLTFEKEAIIIQGIFERVGLKESKEFVELIENIQLSESMK